MGRITKLSLSNQIFLSVMAGGAVGLFLGEYAGALRFLGDAFIGLLQMTVLPYITLALIANIGKLAPSACKTDTFSARARCKFCNKRGRPFEPACAAVIRRRRRPALARF